jgi:hypothetical protein
VLAKREVWETYHHIGNYSPNNTWSILNFSGSSSRLLRSVRRLHRTRWSYVVSGSATGKLTALERTGLHMRRNEKVVKREHRKMTTS